MRQIAQRQVKHLHMRRKSSVEVMRDSTLHARDDPVELIEPGIANHEFALPARLMRNLDLGAQTVGQLGL